MSSGYKRAAAKALIIALAGVYVFFKRAALFQILTVFVFAIAFALILAPLHARLERRGVSSHPAALISVLCLIAAIGVVVSAFIPYLAAHTAQLIAQITPTLTELLQRCGEALSRFGIRFEGQSRWTEMAASLVTGMMTLLARWSIGFAAQTGRIVFSLVITYYLLCEKKTAENYFLLALPVRWRSAFLKAMSGCRNAILGYLSGVMKTSSFVALATFLGLCLLGVPDALLLSLFMGVFEILPYVGPVLAAIPILLLTLPMGLYKSALALLLVILVQQVEGNVVSPYFTASSTSLHPFAALISVFVFGSLFGVWGIVLAVPVVVLTRSILWSLQQSENAVGL